MDEDLQLLEREYCPPIDQALVHAIWADFAGSSGALQSARELLDALKLSAVAEQGTDFDPSGSSGIADTGSAQASGSSGANRSVSDLCSVSEEWLSQTTEDTLESGSSGGCFRNNEEALNLPKAEKEKLLASIFPTLKFELVVRVLARCRDDLDRAMDELLNQAYFADGTEDAIIVPKGIDGFSEDIGVPQRGRKGKGKRRQKGLVNGARKGSWSEADAGCTSPTNNAWLDGSGHVNFIASRTTFSNSAVSSLYHKNGASLPATIRALVEADITNNNAASQPDPTIVEDALALNSDFPSIPLDYTIALIRLTTPSKSHARDLAQALTTNSRGSPLSSLDLIPRYAPIQLSDSTTDSQTALPILAPSATPQTTASLSAARSQAFTQASTAYRRGKSNPLMKAAAGYYSQLGRDLSTHLKAASESDADALVSSQSSATVLDLHGVSVQSATRIAAERTSAWWEGLGEARIPGGGRGGGVIGGGYRIVTGLGRHSEGGRGKLGPAVVRTLVREGWKVEVGEGEVLVLGKARRK